MDLSNKQIDTLAKLLTKKERSEKDDLAFIAGFIYSHGQIVDPEDWYLDEASRKRGILKGYKHNINLKPITGDIQFYYDKKNTMFLNWHNKHAAGMDVVALELQDLGIFLESDNPADQFVEMQRLWNNSNPSYVNKNVTRKELKSAIKEAFEKDRDL